MIRRSKKWLAVAGVFIAVNLAGGIAAALQGEVRHAGVHAVLFIVGVYFARWLAAGRRRGGESASPELSREVGASLAHLEQSVNAVALEVERIGEAQRYITRFVADNRSARAQEAIQIKPPGATPLSPKSQDDR
jgi:hypothetical protein